MVLSPAEMVEKLKELIGAGSEHREITELKNAFYKKMGALRDEALRSHEGDEAFVWETPQEEVEVKALMESYRAQRAKQLKQQEAMQERALAIKQDIVRQLTELVEKSDEVDKTFPLVRELQMRWKDAGQVAPDKYGPLIKAYQLNLEKYYDFVKISNELRDLDLRKNLEAKTALCEAAEALLKEKQVTVASQKLQQLHAEWKEIGPVAHDRREELWQRFKQTSDIINHQRAAYDEERKAQEKKNLQLKTELCEALEALAYEGISGRKEWDDLSAKVMDLQAEWKKIGFAPKKDNDKIYQRFRTRCDLIFAARSAFFKETRVVLADNLARKKELCKEAEELSTSTDWKKTGDRLVHLQQQWREVGPVGRKQSDAVWNRFKAACDTFFQARQAAMNSPEHKQQLSQRGELDKLVRRAESLRQDILTRENNMGFLRGNSKKPSPLLLQMQQQMEQQKKQLADLQAKIATLRKELPNA